MDFRIVPKFAIHNRKLLDKVSECACYHCCKVYQPSDIKEWTDKDDTALCPLCGVDAVLPIYEESEKEIEFLTKLNKYWF